MMKVENISTFEDIERYIEGCINDFESCISDKEETKIYILDLLEHVAKRVEKVHGIKTRNNN